MVELGGTSSGGGGLPRRITLTSRGGIGGLRLPPLVLDTAGLAPAVRAQAATLSASAQSAAPADAVPGRRVPDAMSHELTLDYGDRAVTLKGSDSAPSPAFDALCQLVRMGSGAG